MSLPAIIERPALESVKDEPPACESEFHASGRSGHVPEQHAEFIVCAPCGKSYLCCRGRVERYIRRSATYDNTHVGCECRAGFHFSHEFNWTELP